MKKLTNITYKDGDVTKRGTVDGHLSKSGAELWLLFQRRLPKTAYVGHEHTEISI